MEHLPQHPIPKSWSSVLPDSFPEHGDKLLTCKSKSPHRRQKMPPLDHLSWSLSESQTRSLRWRRFLLRSEGPFCSRLDNQKRMIFNIWELALLLHMARIFRLCGDRKEGNCKACTNLWCWTAILLTDHCSCSGSMPHVGIHHCSPYRSWFHSN